MLNPTHTDLQHHGFVLSFKLHGVAKVAMHFVIRITLNTITFLGQEAAKWMGGGEPEAKMARTEVAPVRSKVGWKARPPIGSSAGSAGPLLRPPPLPLQEPVGPPPPRAYHDAIQRKEMFSDVLSVSNEQETPWSMMLVDARMRPTHGLQVVCGQRCISSC